jgi:hypothetical protein
MPERRRRRHLRAVVAAPSPERPNEDVLAALAMARRDLDEILGAADPQQRRLPWRLWDAVLARRRTEAPRQADRDEPPSPATETYGFDFDEWPDIEVPDRLRQIVHRRAYFFARGGGDKDALLGRSGTLTDFLCARFRRDLDGHAEAREAHLRHTLDATRVLLYAAIKAADNRDRKTRHLDAQIAELRARQRRIEAKAAALPPGRRVACRDVAVPSGRLLAVLTVLAVVVATFADFGSLAWLVAASATGAWVCASRKPWFTWRRRRVARKRIEVERERDKVRKSALRAHDKAFDIVARARMAKLELSVLPEKMALVRANQQGQLEDLLRVAYAAFAEGLRDRRDHGGGAETRWPTL